MKQNRLVRTRKPPLQEERETILGMNLDQLNEELLGKSGKMMSMDFKLTKSKNKSGKNEWCPKDIERIEVLGAQCAIWLLKSLEMRWR